MTFTVPDPLSDLPIRIQFAIASAAARGHATKRIMELSRCDANTVRRVANYYGAPSLGRLAAAADSLRPAAVEEQHRIRVAAGLEPPRPTPDPAAAVSDPQPSRTTPPHLVGGVVRQMAVVSPALAVQAIEQLQQRAVAAKARNLAKRAETMSRKLQQFADDVSAAEAAYQIRQTEITLAEQLEAEQRAARLADLQKARKAAGAATKRAADLERQLCTLTPPEVRRCRAWAVAQGIPVSDRGRIIRRTVVAWTEAGRP